MERNCFKELVLEEHVLIFKNQFSSDFVNKKSQRNLLNIIILLPGVGLDDYLIFLVNEQFKKVRKNLSSLLRKYKENEWFFYLFQYFFFFF